MRAAARTLGVTLKLMEVKNSDDLARVLAMLEKERPDGLTMFFDAKSTGYRALVGDFAKKHRIPTIFGAKEFAQAGGLMSYAPDTAESFRRAAFYVDRILKDHWGGRTIGKPALREFLEDIFGRILGVRWDEIRHFACSELATVEWLTTGTPRGGTRYEVQGCDILTLHNGRIAAKRSYRKAQL